MGYNQYTSYTGSRKCRTCRVTKPVDEYVRDWPHCNSCIAEYQEEWVKEHHISLCDYLNQNPEEI